MYSVSAYFFGKVLAELPASIITPIVYGCIVYFSIGLSTVFAWKFPLFCKINDYSNFISGYIYLSSGLNFNLAKHVNLKILNNIFKSPITKIIAK